MGLNPTLVEDMVQELIAAADLLSDLAADVINTTSDISDIAPYAHLDGRAIHSNLVAAEDRYRQVAFEAASRANIVEQFDISEFGDHATNAILESLMDKDLIGPTLIDHEAALREVFDELVAEGMDPADAAITANRRYAAQLIADTLKDNGVPANQAEALAAAGLQAVSEMEAAGVAADLAVQLVFLGAVTGLTPDQVAAQATSQQTGEELFTLFANTAHLMGQAALQREDAELTALLDFYWDDLTAVNIYPPGYEDRGDSSDKFRRILANRSDNDDRISKDDLEWIINNPAGIDPALLDVAQRLLDNPTLLARLDSAKEETDFLNGQFGSTAPADNLISRTDLDAFINMSILTTKLSPYRDEIDTAANGGEIDGIYSRADYEKFLESHPELETEIEAILDAGLYEKGYWERNRDSIAITAALASGVFVGVVSGGILSGPAAVLVGFAAGARSAAETTRLINNTSGLDPNDGVVKNAVTGGLVALPGIGTGTGITSAVTTGVSRTALIEIGVGTADYLALHGADFALPDNIENSIANGSLIVGLGSTPFALDAALMRSRVKTLLGEPGDVITLGRRADTAAAESWNGHVILNVPGPEWSWQLNRAWIEEAIAQRRPIRLVSDPLLESNLIQETGEFAGKPTIFAREMDVLDRAGYVLEGQMMVPPP